MNILSLDLRPTYCNRWPELFVDFNTYNLLTKVIDSNQIIELEFKSVDVLNTLMIGIKNKNFGSNGIWDTQIDKDNNILNDLTLEIVDARINNISILDVLINNKYCINNTHGQEHLPSKIDTYNIIAYNGHFIFEYKEPLINSIINQKYKQNLDNEKSYFSNYTTRFNYDQDLKLIQEIYQILDEAKKFNSKRS